MNKHNQPINKFIFYSQKPRVSCGLVGYKKINGEIKYVSIRRKHSISYFDIIKGKYNDYGSAYSPYYLFEGITVSEKIKLTTLSFRELWLDAWLNHSKAVSKEFKWFETKFNTLNLDDIPDELKWVEPEYGFPKGRKKGKETYAQCAIREFCEESGISRNNILVDTKKYYTEEYIGLNGEYYKNIYFLAEILTDKIPLINDKKREQGGEVSLVVFLTYKELYNKIRDYSTATRHFIFKMNDIVLKKCYVSTK
jgi:8-oxo-dGTP pyrophosphatase MutT (NUDIX family)